MSKISIALCTYNGADFLSEQLESFAAQTRQPDELVVNDDCSSDETIEILENFARVAPFPVSLEINEKNLGSVKNFERAISRCAGDIIFLSDQDDVWLPEKIAKMTTAFEKDEQIGMVSTNAELVNEKLEPLGKDLWDFSFTLDERRQAEEENFLWVLLRRNVVTGATMAFRARYRDAFLPIPIDIPNTIHDAWISLIIAAQAEVEFIDENLIKYRQHARQQLGVDWQDDFQARRLSYEDSIIYCRKEIERLLKIEEILKNHPLCQSNKNGESIAEFTQNYIEELDQRIRHYEARKNLPSNKLNRLPPILKELQTGRYHRFSKGFLSAAKDLLGKLQL